MALFPNANLITYNGEDSAIREDIETFYADALMVNQTYLHEASIDARFNAGDQSLWSEIYNVPIRNRKSWNFNLLRRITNITSGLQRNNRKSLIVTPEDINSQNGADQFTKLLSAINRNANLYATMSDAFDGATITGLNLLQVWIDYRSDPISGDIKIDNCNYNSFIMDPFFRKKDLSDCNAMWKRSFLSKDACMSLIPDKKKEIEEMTAYYNDGKFNYLPENNFFNSKLLAYDEYYYRAYRDQKLLVDPDAGKQIEWNGSDEALKEFLSINPQIKVIDTKIPTVNLALLVNGNVLYNGMNPLNIDTYPFIPVFAYFEPDVPNYSLRIQGIIRDLRDAQFLFNRIMINQYDMLESRSNSGYIYKEDSLVDPDDPMKTGNGRSIRLKAGAEMGDIIPIASFDIPNSIPQLAKMTADLLETMSGANGELLGSDKEFVSAALARYRTGQGLIAFRKLFDQFESSQELMGEILIKVMQKNYTPGKIESMIGEQPVEEFYNKMFSKYKVAVEEGFDSATQKQLEFMQLMNLKNEAKVEIPDSALINAATLQNKKDLIAAIAQQKQEVQQLEQQQSQMNIAEQQATINMVNAKAQSDLTVAEKNKSSVTKDKFDMINETTETARKEQAANLDAVKVLKDLEQSDPNKIDELVELMRIIQLERDQMAQEEQEQHPFIGLIQQQMNQQPIAQEEAPMGQAFNEQQMQPQEQQMQPEQEQIMPPDEQQML